MRVDAPTYTLTEKKIMHYFGIYTFLVSATRELFFINVPIYWASNP